MTALTRHASCRCGQIRIACTGEPIRVSVCHCRECKARSGSAFADAPRDQGATSNNPWGGNDNAAGSDLSRDAGLNDVGGNDRSAGLFDNSGNDTSGDYDVADSGDNDDFGGDFGGGDSSDA